MKKILFWVILGIIVCWIITEVKQILHTDEPFPDKFKEWSWQEPVTLTGSETLSCPKEMAVGYVTQEEVDKAPFKWIE